MHRAPGIRALGVLLLAISNAGCGASAPPPVAAAPVASAPPVAEPRDVVVADEPVRDEPVARVEPEVSVEAEPAATPRDPALAPSLSPAVVAHLRELVAAHPDRLLTSFVKVGDSATVNRAFLRCLSRDQSMELDRHQDLRPLIESVRGTRVAGSDPFSRESQAAGVGWSVHRVLRGHPNPVVREVRDLNPRFAFVMFGGNDIELGRISRYATRLTRLVDQLLSLGVMPVLSTIPPRNDDADADLEVPRYNALIQAVARSRRVPVLDLHQAMAGLPHRGLASDGVHPNAPIYHGRARGCDFTESGLSHGQNLRNLMTLRVLASLSSALREAPTVAAAPPPSPGASRGTRRVVGSPFATLASTVGGVRERAHYPGCEESAPELGPERRYALHLETRSRVRAEVMYTDGVDVDVHVLAGGRCISRGDRRLEVVLDPGEYEVVVDTFGPTPRASRDTAGEYALLLEREAAEDTAAP